PSEYSPARKGITTMPQGHHKRPAPTTIGILLLPGRALRPRRLRGIVGADASEYSSCPEGHYDRSGDEIESVDDELRRDEEADERDWLDQPGDDDGTGWTNFDYSAAEELADEWDGDE